MKNSNYWVLLLSLVLTGCSSNLKQWTQEELSPYLAKELSQHPRFKQQPIVLVDMQGEQVEANIDALTTEIRDQVFNTLLQHKGANIIWQSSNTALQHHSYLHDLQCSPKQKKRFYIGFDLKPINDQFQLSVKALDPEQGRWVSGFGKTWQGSLSRQELQKLSQTYPDEILRGLRPLPFTEQQIDLLANYLAKNISCLLQQSSTPKLYIYPEINAQHSLYVKNTMALVGNYLSRFNEVTIVNKLDKANIILKAQFHHIDKNLHQLWLVAQDNHTEQHIKGMDTAAYVTLSDAAFEVSAVKPVISSSVQKPETVIIRPTKAVHFFNTLSLISPIGEPFCRTTNPWAMGEYPIKVNFPVSHCFGLKVSLNQDAEVFLINKNSQGQYYRLLPDYGQSRFKLFAGEQLRYPESKLFDLSAHISTEYIEAFAVNNPFVANKLRRLLRTMPVCCEMTGYFDKTDWVSQLQAFREEYRKNIDWKVIKLTN